MRLGFSFGLPVVWTLALCVFLLGSVSAYAARDLYDHFTGIDPKCVSRQQPVLLVADVTQSGEIDDTISLSLYHHLETFGCIKVIGVVSIHGNGGSSTKEVHHYLINRLRDLGIDEWEVFRGPDATLPFSIKKKASAADKARLQRIAKRIRRSAKPVSIVELGPFTVSARLLHLNLAEPKHIKQIIGVGGRTPNEQFSLKGGLPFFAFRDMNVAEDRAAITYLLRNHSKLLNVVTYRTGIGRNMITPEMVASAFNNPEIARHAFKRAKTLRWIGYKGFIPSWDTWTIFPFIKGLNKRLDCKQTYAQMRHAGTGYKPTDSMQLQLFELPTQYTRPIIACHSIVKEPATKDQ